MTGYPIFFKKKDNTLFFEKNRIPLILDDGGSSVSTAAPQPKRHQDQGF